MAIAAVRAISLVEPSIRPPLKWVGGKRWLLPHLAPLWAPYRETRLVEPFCGGLAVSLGLRPDRALVNDINPHLIHFYRWLQRGLRIGVAMENDSVLYYQHRAAFNALTAADEVPSREAAELFYFLNRTGYNGLCRFNRAGRFNVPFGRYKSITYTRDFSPYRGVLGGWQFSTEPFERLPIEPTDFIYADPPFDVPFTQYTRQGFDWADQVRLAEWLAGHPGPVALSNQATPRIMELYRDHGFAIRILQAPRLISCTGDRSPAAEVLATRNLPA